MSDEVKWLDHKPEWDDDMFDGCGGFVGESEHTRILCDREYAGLIPWDDITYILFPHSECGRDV